MKTEFCDFSSCLGSRITSSYVFARVHEEMKADSSDEDPCPSRGSGSCGCSESRGCGGSSQGTMCCTRVRRPSKRESAWSEEGSSACWWTGSHSAPRSRDTGEPQPSSYRSHPSSSLTLSTDTKVAESRRAGCSWLVISLRNLRCRGDGGHVERHVAVGVDGYMGTESHRYH